MSGIGEGFWTVIQPEKRSSPFEVLYGYTRDLLSRASNFRVRLVEAFKPSERHYLL